jgi:hypothetical protein
MVGADTKSVKRVVNGPMGVTVADARAVAGWDEERDGRQSGPRGQRFPRTVSWHDPPPELASTA